MTQLMGGPSTEGKVKGLIGFEIFVREFIILSHGECFISDY